MGGPEKWQKRGRAKRVLSRFCRVENRFLEICGNLRKRAPLSFIIFREIFFVNSAIFIHSPYQTGSQPMSGR